MGDLLLLSDAERSDEPFGDLIKAVADFVVTTYRGSRGEIARATIALYGVEHDQEFREHVKTLVRGLRVLNLADEDASPILQRLASIFIAESVRLHTSDLDFEKNRKVII